MQIETFNNIQIGVRWIVVQNSGASENLQQVLDMREVNTTSDCVLQ